MAKKKRNYREEYDSYHSKPEQKKRRAERNRDRAAAEKAGKVRKGDGKEVDHMNAPRKGSLAKAKTQVISKAANRRKQPKRS
jgi:hypothetical protein